MTKTAKLRACEDQATYMTKEEQAYLRKYQAKVVDLEVEVKGMRNEAKILWQKIERLQYEVKLRDVALKALLEGQEI